MAVTNGWGQAAKNNTNGYGKLATNNVGAGSIYDSSYAGDTALIGVTVSAAFSYSAASFTQADSNPTPTITGTTGGTFSGTSGLVFVSTSTGEINLSASSVAAHVVTYTVDGVSADFSLSVTAASLLLDTYSGADVAFSLRKLSSTYSGSVIRVRRSNDNSEQDIGFTNNLLDTASLTSFVGSNDGFVTKWYDQSGNANDSAQVTATRQPQIVTGGVLQTNNTKPSMSVTGSDSLIFSTITPVTTFSVAKIDNLTTVNYIFFGSTQGYFYGGTFSGIDGIGIFDGAIKSLTGEDTNTHLGYFNYNGTNFQIAKDGNSITDFSNGSNFSIFSLGRRINNLTLGGQLQEVVIYPNTQSSNKSNIETNINNFYTIF